MGKQLLATAIKSELNPLLRLLHNDDRLKLAKLTNNDAAINDHIYYDNYREYKNINQFRHSFNAWMSGDIHIIKIQSIQAVIKYTTLYIRFKYCSV